MTHHPNRSPNRKDHYHARDARYRGAPARPRFFVAANALDSDGMIAPFTDDGLLNDIQREFWGPAAIKRWADKESVGDHVVTTDFTDVKEHHGSWIISAAVDGDYDKSGLPDPLILTYYFTLDGNRIASLIILGNKPGY